MNKKKKNDYKNHGEISLQQKSCGAKKLSLSDYDFVIYIDIAQSAAHLNKMTFVITGFDRVIM